MFNNEDENTSHFNYPREYEEDRPLSSVQRQVVPSNATGIGSIGSDSTTPAQIQIKPCNSKDLVTKLLKQSIEKFQLQAKLSSGLIGQTPQKENESQNKSFRGSYQEILTRQSSQKVLHQQPQQSLLMNI